MKITYGCGHTIDHPNINCVEPYMDLVLCGRCRRTKNSAARPSEIVYACGHRVSQSGGTGPAMQNPKPCKRCRAKERERAYLACLESQGKRRVIAIYECGCHVEVVLKKGAPDVVHRSGACPSHNVAFNRMGGVGDYCQYKEEQEEEEESNEN